MNVGKRTFVAIIVVAAASVTQSAYATPISYTKYLAAWALVRTLTLAEGKFTGEQSAIDRYYDEYRKEQEIVAFFGQPALQGAFPVNTALRIGDTGVLTFQFVDPTTGSVTSGPDIGSVFYEVNIDPLTPDVFIPLGSATDPSSNFIFKYVLSGFEPVIQATPFDPFGNPIVIIGQESDNVAVGAVINIPVAEPPTMDLLILALVSLLGWRRTWSAFLKWTRMSIFTAISTQANLGSCLTRPNFDLEGRHV